MKGHLIVLVLGILGQSSGSPFPEVKGASSIGTTTATAKVPVTSPSPLSNNQTTGTNNSTVQVTIYVFNIHSFLGGPWTMEVSGCVQVPKLLYKKTSSIDTLGNCLLLFGRENCEGQEVKLPATQNDTYFSLNAFNFDDVLASLRPCDDLKDRTIETFTERPKFPPKVNKVIHHEPKETPKDLNRPKRSEVITTTTKKPQPCDLPSPQRQPQIPKKANFQAEEISWDPNVPDISLVH